MLSIFSPNLSAHTFSLFFIAAVLMTTALRYYLSWRHMNYIAAHRASVPPLFADRISLEAHQKAADYAQARIRFGQLSLAIDTSLLLFLTVGGFIGTLHELWQPRLGTGYLYSIAMVFSLTLISSVLDIPQSLYRQFVIEEKFGFNRMTLKLFLLDMVKGALLGLAVGTPLLLAVLWFMNTTGSLWWLYVWIFWCGFNLLLLFIYPIWIAPLFNTFTPLADSELKTRIEALLTRCGFASKGLFVMDGSKRSAHGNAYFTGFGKNKRIVFFDTLIERLTPTEAEAVLAHELGHFKHKHVLKRIISTFALTLAGLWLMGQLMTMPWFYAGLGVPAQNAVLALILFFLAAPSFTFLLTPLSSMISRKHEYEADAYAAKNASATELVRALVKLYEDNASTLTPDPLHSLFYDSHPPAALRIAHLKQQA
ncbi:MAG: M48 family metallopeptidase [Pseudomonadota bacterium]